MSSSSPYLPNEVAYIYHGNYIPISDQYLPTENRNEMVHTLIESYGLLQFMNCVKSVKATDYQLKEFHSADYINLIKAASNNEIDDESCDEELVDAGLKYDCPLKEGLFEYCQEIAGGTISAAKLLNSGVSKVAIHWMGGWHHAQRSNAAGFCYINDCVLGILELRKHFNRVLYIDIDVHHGDGVQDAFYGTDKVITLSTHRFEPGFYPGTGSLNDFGRGRGKYYCINLPFHEGLQDSNFINTISAILKQMYVSYKPDAVVFQAGADGLNKDPMHGFNLTEKSYIACTKQILEWSLPTLVLGGGGYNEANTARCWTVITATILKQAISNDIPDNKYFLKYGPGYELDMPLPLKSDLHNSEYLDNITKTIMSRFSFIDSK